MKGALTRNVFLLRVTQGLANSYKLGVLLVGYIRSFSQLEYPSPFPIYSTEGDLRDVRVYIRTTEPERGPAIALPNCICRSFSGGSWKFERAERYRSSK